MKEILSKPTRQNAKEKKEFGVRLGKQLRKLREDKGMTQEELALKAGFYRTYVGHIENGTYSPSVYTVWKLAKAMDLSLTKFLEAF